MVKQPGNAETLAVLKLDLGFGSAGRYGRDRETRNRKSVRKVERTHLWNDLQPDNVVVGDVTGEFQAHTEGPELDSDGAKICAALHDGKGKFASGKEARRFPAYRHEIGLRQDLQNVLGLEVPDRRAQVQVRTEKENIEQIVDGKRDAGRGRCRKGARARARGR